MRGLSQEMMLALLFGAVLLVQFLYGKLRRKAESLRAQVEREAEPVAVASAAAPAEAAPQPAAARAPAPAKTPVRVALRTPPRARRFSRAALMPDRRAVQDAIVVAAILQPCHAQRGDDNGR